MSLSDELKALAERVQALTGPCRETDARIWQLTNPDFNYWSNVNTTRGLFTASLDAAMTLVPDDAMWRVGNDGEGGDPGDYIAQIMTAPPQCWLLTSVAATHALALTAAALLARAATKGSPHDDHHNRA